MTDTLKEKTEAKQSKVLSAWDLVPFKNEGDAFRLSNTTQNKDKNQDNCLQVHVQRLQRAQGMGRLGCW
jgi:hypothetical protein